jgi:chemotaxis signal transduction protein
MAGGVSLEVGDFPINPEDAEQIEGFLNLRGDLVDAVDFPLLKQFHASCLS